jgi:hypothetical protein
MLRPLNNGLAGLYKLAGVDIVEEQVSSLLPQSREFDLTSSNLVVWADAHRREAVYYDLRSRGATLRPHHADSAAVSGWPEVETARLLFARVPLSWDEWVDCWQKDQEGLEQPRLPGPAGELLLPQAQPADRADRSRESDATVHEGNGQRKIVASG